MKEKRKKIYLGILSLYTTVNLLLVYKIKGSGELRDSWQQVYIRAFHWWDILLFIGILCLTYFLFNMCITKCIPKIRQFYQKKVMKRNDETKTFQWQMFSIFLVIWFFFFLVFYPGTAMNDTVYILEKPWELSNQHPILYNLYTYGLFCLGRWLWNPNFGLALISLVQMFTMALVLTKAIALLYKKGAAVWLCYLYTLYFACAPIFFTYAFSAIKDTPFSICLFALVLQLYELADSKGEIFFRKSFCFQMVLSLFGIISFRSNGLFIMLGTAILLLFLYKKCRKQLLLLFVGVILFQRLLNVLIMPNDVEPLFQEKVGIPIQQVGAVVVKGDPLTTEQEEYLYRLLPKEEWQKYAPECSDVLKWNDQFDREYLNQTKKQFIRIWGELYKHNLAVYTEAYILETYGIWGIETRNKEQYYFKDIYENNMGLEQISPLPGKLVTLVHEYYCNRFTYRYLSMGTAFWILFVVTLWLMYRRKYMMTAVTLPLWMLFASLLVATPIAFCFRYGFVMALVFPFSISMPFMEQEVSHE